MLANVPYSSAQIAQIIGRPLSNNARQIEVPVIAPGTVFGGRINQLDFRIGKVFNLDRARFVINLDLHNALNTDAILELSQDYGANGNQFLNAAVDDPGPRDADQFAGRLLGTRLAQRP